MNEILEVKGLGRFRAVGPFKKTRLPDGSISVSVAVDPWGVERTKNIPTLDNFFAFSLPEPPKSPPVRPGRIPVMDDPLGKHWRQPKNLRDRVEIYETHAVISEADFFALPNYETTTPGGVYPGKVWRQGRKFLCWWGPDKGGKCRCCCVRALIV